jgi:hypothetical protein
MSSKVMKDPVTCICADNTASSHMARHSLTALFCRAAACTNGNYLATVGSNRVCAACVSRSATQAYNSARKCYRSVSLNGGRACGAHYRLNSVGVCATILAESLGGVERAVPVYVSCIFVLAVPCQTRMGLSHTAELPRAPLSSGEHVLISRKLCAKRTDMHLTRACLAVLLWR